MSNYLVEVATLVSDDAEDDEDDAAEVEASDDAFSLRFQGCLFQNRCYRLPEHRFHNRLK